MGCRIVGADGSVFSFFVIIDVLLGLIPLSLSFCLTFKAVDVYLYVFTWDELIDDMKEKCFFLHATIIMGTLL